MARSCPYGEQTVRSRGAFVAATSVLVVVVGLGIGAVIGLPAGAAGGWLARTVGRRNPAAAGD